MMGSKSLIRSRWAAIGAAVAVTLGGGGLIGVSAASGDASSLKTTTPTRIMDTRQGSDGKVSGETVALQVTGEITTYASNGTTPAATVVPAGANAVAVNLTVTQGERNQGYGFVTAFPCAADSDTVPNASTLNFVEGTDVANSTVVPLGATGKMCLNVYGSAHVIVDVSGYYETAAAGAAAVDAYTKAESDAKYVTEVDAYTKAETDAALDEKWDEANAIYQVVDYSPSTGLIYESAEECGGTPGFNRMNVTIADTFVTSENCEFHLVLNPPNGDNRAGSSKESEYDDSTGEVSDTESQWVVDRVHLCWQTNSAMDLPVSKDMWLWAYGTNPVGDYRTAATYLDLERYDGKAIGGLTSIWSLPFAPANGATVAPQASGKNVNCGYVVPEGSPLTFIQQLAALDEPLKRYSKQLGAQQWTFGWEFDENEDDAGDLIDAYVDIYSVSVTWRLVNVAELSEATNS